MDYLCKHYVVYMEVPECKGLLCQEPYNAIVQAISHKYKSRDIARKPGHEADRPVNTTTIQPDNWQHLFRRWIMVPIMGRWLQFPDTVQRHTPGLWIACDTSLLPLAIWNSSPCGGNEVCDSVKSHLMSFLFRQPAAGKGVYSSSTTNWIGLESFCRGLWSMAPAQRESSHASNTYTEGAKWFVDWSTGSDGENQRVALYRPHIIQSSQRSGRF